VRLGLHEFVGEDADGVDGGGFGAEDDGAEAEGEEALGASEAVFCWGEVAFWADEDECLGDWIGGGGGGVCEDGFEAACVGVDGGDEFEVCVWGGGDELVHGDGGMDGGEPVLAALFAGFDGGALPFVAAVGAFGGVEADDGAFADEWDDFGGSEFGGFLEDEFHVFAFGDGLGESDAGWEGRGAVGMDGAEDGFAFGGEGDFGGPLGALAVEDDDAGAFAEAEDLVAVVAFGFVEADFFGVAIGGVDVEAGEAHGSGRGCGLISGEAWRAMWCRGAGEVRGGWGGGIRG